MPKAVAGVAAAEAELALVPEEPAQQGPVAAREERARRPEAVGMLLVVVHRPERSVEARHQVRSEGERLLTAIQTVL